MGFAEINGELVDCSLSLHLASARWDCIDKVFAILKQLSPVKQHSCSFP